MAKVKEELEFSPVLAKIRLDIRGEAKQGKFLFGGKNITEVAAGAREQKVALLRNVPVQGMYVEDIDVTSEIYVVFDEESNCEVAYAPVLLTVRANSLEELSRFIVSEEFRKIEILEPMQMSYSPLDIERFLFSISKEVKSFQGQLERRYHK